MGLRRRIQRGYTTSPSHTYADPGTSTVTLTATNLYGSDTITKYDIVTVNGQVMSNGAIYAQSVPYGATIYVNGESYGTSPVTVNSLLPGTYSVMAYLSGYSADVRTVTVYSGQTTGYYPSLQVSPNPRERSGQSLPSPHRRCNDLRERGLVRDLAAHGKQPAPRHLLGDGLPERLCGRLPGRLPSPRARRPVTRRSSQPCQTRQIPGDLCAVNS